MDFLLACMIFFASLIYSLIQGLHVLIPLIFGLLLFTAMGIRRGNSLYKVLGMVGRGMSKVSFVLLIFALIGALTAVWRSSGTIQFLVYHGISMINGDYFIVSAFILTSFVSLLLGSSMGTVGTIGIVLMIIARSGGADANMTAGAIVAGAYVGDRCAPTSSGASLVAALTNTYVIDNVYNMVRSAAVPMVLSLAAYFYLSFSSRMSSTDNAVLDQISRHYDIGLITIIPAVLIIILSILRFRVTVSISAGIISAFFIAMFVQGVSAANLFNYMLLGYRAEEAGELARIISGGGIISMFGIMVIVLTASGYSGIFEETGLLDDVIILLKKMSEKLPLYHVTLITATFSAALGCNQSLSIIMTSQLMKNIYEKKSSKSSLALDIEDSSVVVAPLLPWNIAVSVPMAILSVGPSCIPYAVFLYFLPLYRMFSKGNRKIKSQR